MQIDPARLIKARVGRAMSQEEAAIAADLSARTIQRIEAGQPPSLESTKALLTVFGSDIIHDPEVATEEAFAQSPWHGAVVRLGNATRLAARVSFAGLRILFAAVFLLIFIAKPIIPERAGLFVRGNDSTLGVLSTVPSGSKELLGYWVMPLMLLAMTAILLSIGEIRRLVWCWLHNPQQK